MENFNLTYEQGLCYFMAEYLKNFGDFFYLKLAIL